MRCFEHIHQNLKTPIWSIYDQSFVTSVPLPCGKCHACIQRKIAEWTFRLETERINAACTYFVTLTYDTHYVPINKYGRMTLDKTDAQGFFKLLRHEADRNPNYGAFEKHYFKEDVSQLPIKYYLCGEYGSVGKRPHMHMIITNASKHAIREIWTYGDVDIQLPISSAAMGYVAKYLYKRIYKVTPGNVAPEFSLMSKGIGECYIPKMKSWHNKNLDVLYTVNESGIKAPMSKYYRERLFDEPTRKKQIPIIKKQIEEEERKQRIVLGDNYEFRMSQQKIAFTQRMTSKMRPRKEL